MARPEEKARRKGVDNAFKGESWDKTTKIAEENGLTPKDVLPENPFNQATPDGRKKFIKYYMERVPNYDYYNKRKLDKMFTLETLEEVMSDTSFWQFLERLGSCGVYDFLMHVTDSFRDKNLTNKLLELAKRANNTIAMEEIMEEME